MRTQIKRTTRLAAAAVLVLAMSGLSQSASAAPVVGGQVYSQGGDVTVELLPATAGYTSELHLCNDGPPTPGVDVIMENHDPVGTTVNLGSFPSGTEMIFCIYVQYTEDTFYMGPASRNPDALEHAAVDQIDTATAIVGFEDIFGGGDLDYDDNVFRFTGVSGNQAPDCSTVAGDPNSLWPPEHQFVRVNIGGAADPDGDTVSLTIADVTQDEPVPGPGVGHDPDAKRVADDGDSVDLRAERNGTGDGRVYRIAVTGDDGNGGTCTGTAIVGVPHDQDGDPAVDSGGSYNSFG